ncbi:MAG: hypothetical protein AAF467_01530 [Actinomycetota bacterium]
MGTPNRITRRLADGARLIGSIFVGPPDPRNPVLRRRRVWVVLGCGLMAVVPALWTGYVRQRTTEQVETDPLRPAVSVAGPNTAEDDLPSLAPQEGSTPSITRPTIGPGVDS